MSNQFFIQTGIKPVVVYNFFYLFRSYKILNFIQPLTLKRWVTRGTKIRHGIPSNWRIFESNWLFDSQYQVNLIQIFTITRNPGLNFLVLSMTQLFRSKWLPFFLSMFFARNCAKSHENPVARLHRNR